MKQLIKRLVLHPLERKLIRRKWLFFAMPKCGSSTVFKFAQENRMWVHHHGKRGNENYVELFDRPDLDERMVFTFIRDPIERFDSAFRYLKGGGRVEGDKIDGNYFVGNLNADEFVDKWMGDEHGWGELREQQHFRPMVDWIHNREGQCVVDLILPMSQMDMMLQRLFRKSCNYPFQKDNLVIVNRSKVQHAVQFSEQSKERIREFYSDDFKLYEMATGK